jgi:uracil-DNA glycosylase
MLTLAPDNLNGRNVTVMTESIQQDTLDRIYMEYDSDPSFLHLRKDAKQLIRGNGPSDPLIVFIGEAPGKQEDESGVPFTGNSGELLDELLREIGVNRSDVFITNIPQVPT